MFTDADKYRLFTTEDLEERLGKRCSVDWFLRRFQLRRECGGKLVLGSEILRALADPPAAGSQEEESAPSCVVEVVDHQRPQRFRTLADRTRSLELTGAVKPRKKRGHAAPENKGPVGRA